MTLDEFHNIMEVSIDSFVSHWREMNSKFPNIWPYEADSDEWLDQFISYLEDRQDANGDSKCG